MYTCICAEYLWRDTSDYLWKEELSEKDVRKPIDHLTLSFF